MFNVGAMEVLVIAIGSLVVLGPDKLPGALRQFGAVAAEVRRVSNGFRVHLNGPLEGTEPDPDAAPDAVAARPSADNRGPGVARAVAQAEMVAAESARDDASAVAANDDPSAI